MRHHLTLRSRLGAAALGGLVLLAAACGTDAEPTATVASTAPDTASTTASGDPTDTTAATDTTADDGSGTTTDDAPTGGTTPDGEPVDVCTLLTADDAADALGEDVVPGFVQERDECEWMTEDELRTVQVARLSDDVDTWRLGHSTDSFEEVDGLGEEAYYGSVFDDVSFLVGDEVYEVDVELRGDGDGRETAIALAEVVEGRL